MTCYVKVRVPLLFCKIDGPVGRQHLGAHPTPNLNAIEIDIPVVFHISSASEKVFPDHLEKHRHQRSLAYLNVN
jgi:hypothetical protein